MNQAWLDAADKGDLVKVQRLLPQVDINATNSGGWTALHWASYNGQQAVAALLIEKGANIHAKTNNGMTALMDATSEGHTELAKYLQMVSDQQSLFRSKQPFEKQGIVFTYTSPHQTPPLQFSTCV